jgi:hypothetical protein
LVLKLTAVTINTVGLLKSDTVVADEALLKVMYLIQFTRQICLAFSIKTDYYAVFCFCPMVGKKVY